MCIADTSTARVAPKQRAARHEQAPAPAFAVVAPAKRFDATEQDARCVRARDASPTRERHPDERDARESSRRDARTHHVRSTPPTATRASSSRGRAVRVPGARVGRRFGFFRGREQPIATATRAGNGARAVRRDRARSARAVDAEPRSFAQTRRDRAARSRRGHLLRTTRHRDETTPARG
jgi:hypothetical protein